MARSPTGSRPKLVINPPVFWSAAGLILLLVVLTSAFPIRAQALFAVAQDWIVINASWFYILTVALILLSIMFCMISRYGGIKLGPDHSQPDYSNTTWFAMLFCAGMGIGLMFFGVAEPLMHTIAPPVGDPMTVAAAKEAMRITFFHWGLHAWAIYAVVALSLAFFSFRHGLPLTLRSALYPLIGERIRGPIGHAVDVFAIIGTVFGVATSLGFGVLQINSGLNLLLDVPVNTTVQVILIAVATALATMSAASGLDKGVRRLSELNMILAILLMLFVFLAGPTVFLLKAFVQNTGSYLSEIVNKTFNLYAYEQTDWMGGWTLLYWAWWISWSPFVGMFIARVSRGRSIREFVGGVIFVPAGFTFLWMTVFGDTAIHMLLADGYTELAQIVKSDNSLALFALLDRLPMATFMSYLAVVMVLIFFVTSADSGALVVDLLASGGSEHNPVWQRVFWSVSMGGLAIVLLLADGLAALQTMTIISALPFAVVLLAVLAGLLRALRLDLVKRGMRYQNHLAPRAQHGDDNWRRRLRNLMVMPRRAHVNRFIQEVVKPACEDVAQELQGNTQDVKVTELEQGGIRLEVMHGDEIDFIYEVRPRAYARPTFTVNSDDDSNDERKYFRAEAHLKEGGQNYDVMGWNRNAVIGDILDQYEKHLHYLHLLR
ncbi:choline/glycine/proline betaine transport protein [Kerstersia gyiorum]|uniref:BCCT family transporter n=1 Tax=Kerstersia gyiorum TaxID=206506 RepID=UPI00209F52CA|nr:choline BCCT transporter BetT [Kerstersia gyiorum]MCP1713927.1 choline/glycine/proline betaine transport protein [Kerstersia gyiorum]